MYKYIVNVEGNCAALRLKQLLAGPSAVFFVQSDEIEWFYRLLTPYVHYIPVSFSRAGVHNAWGSLAAHPAMPVLSGGARISSPAPSES